MPKKSVSRGGVRGYVARLNFAGLLLGALFIYASFLPSLLPRGWVLQGILSAVLFCIGYGIGVIASYLLREFKIGEPKPKKKAEIKKWTYLAMLALFLIFAILGEQWQHTVSKLVGQPPENDAYIIGMVLVFAIFVAFILLVSRSIRSLFGWFKKIAFRFLPRRVAFGLAWLVTVLVVWGLVNGVILNFVGGVLNEAYSVKNDTTAEGIVQPTNPELSGSKASDIPWDSLGRQGRNFIGEATPTAKISGFSHSTAMSPVRIYSGLKSADTTQDRADLAVKDLTRAGGFNRKVIVVVTTTGTGWVDEDGIEPIEYMYNGDSAIVAMQYSYLPSSLSFLVDQQKAKDAGRDLYSAVYEHWLQMPANNRPKLVVFGESLGSFGSETAFTNLADFKGSAGGAVWVGPPNFNTLHRTATANRDKGSPEILPIVQNGATLRFATRPQDLAKPNSTWTEPRAVYLQNPSDPIVWWSPKLLFERPDWLNEPRGTDVSTATRWLPIVSFWQVSGDMVFSTGVPDGHGHKYGKLPTDAWGDIAPPAGWNSDKTQELKKLLSS